MPTAKFGTCDAGHFTAHLCVPVSTSNIYYPFVGAPPRRAKLLPPGAETYGETYGGTSTSARRIVAFKNKLLACAPVRPRATPPSGKMQDGMRLRRQQHPRLPILATRRPGHCFLAAMLAHALDVNLDKNSVPMDSIKELRRLDRVPNKGYLAGDAQQAIAEHLRAGYVVVQPDTRTCSPSTARSPAPSTMRCSWQPHLATWSRLPLALDSNVA